MRGLLIIVYIAILVFEIAALWRVFTKADEAGWKAIIPIWNILVLLRIIGRSYWWIILFLIPLVNIIVGLIISLDLAKSFGKGNGFRVGIWLLGWIFIPILGFGSSTYERGGPGVAALT